MINDSEKLEKILPEFFCVLGDNSKPTVIYQEIGIMYIVFLHEVYSVHWIVTRIVFFIIVN